MAETLFYILAAGSLFGAGNVVFRKNPVVSLMFLVFTFFCLSGIYLLLGFSLLAAIQLLVYTGAILVLFLFVILLLDLKREEKAPPGPRLVLGSLCFFSLFVLGLLITLWIGLPAGEVPALTLGGGEAALDPAAEIGKALFSTYLIPFEATGILLLVTIAGVLILSQRDKEGTA